MRSRLRRLVVSVLVGIAFLVILFTALMHYRTPNPVKISGPAPPTVPTPKTKPKPPPVIPPYPRPCLDMAHAKPDAYADDAHVSNGAFGPTVYHRGITVAGAVHELVLRLCGRPGHGPDRRLYAAESTAGSVSYLDPDRAISTADWVDGVNWYVYQIERAPAHLEPLPAGSKGGTMFMEPKAGRDPFVGVTDLPQSSAHLLVIKFGSVTLRLKLECGFQPVAKTGNPPPQWEVQFAKP